MQIRFNTYNCHNNVFGLFFFNLKQILSPVFPLSQQISTRLQVRKVFASLDSSLTKLFCTLLALTLQLSLKDPNLCYPWVCSLPFFRLHQSKLPSLYEAKLVSESSFFIYI